MLTLVPTPIGNLQDITLRALEVLKNADLILAEDTRTARFLLQHFQIEKRILSHHQHNEHNALKEVIRLLKEGNKIALVSDAGTPAISDPGFLIVRECIKAHGAHMLLNELVHFDRVLVRVEAAEEAGVVVGVMMVAETHLWATGKG